MHRLSHATGAPRQTGYGEHVRLGLQMLDEAAVRRMGDPLGEQPIGACLQSAQRHPESVRRERPLLAAGAHPQGCYQQPARLDSSG